MTAAKKVLDKITSYSSVVIFIAMVLMVTYQVIARYFFKSPSSVTEVLTRYCFVWLIIISATYMFGQREHINISVIKDKLPKTPKMIVSIIIELVTICFAGLVMVYGGFTIAKMNLVQLDTILHIPTGVIYSIIPICGVIIIFYSSIIIFVEHAIIDQFTDCLKCKIWIDRTSAIAKKCCKMMNLSWFSGFQNDCKGSAFFRFYKMLMYCGNSQ